MSDLAERVARLFSTKPWKHVLAGDTSYDEEVRCGKCKVLMYNRNQDCMDDWWLDEHKVPCRIPDPIDITDLGKALECFRGLEAVPFSIMATAYNRNANRPKSATCLNVMRWLLKHATAEQIWEICCLAKESE
jgi:hypothetical protein